MSYNPPAADMEPRWARFVPLLYILFSSVQSCEIPNGKVKPINSLNTELLQLAGDASQEPSPSLYLGLRLSDEHSPEKEKQYLRRLKEAFQPNVSRTSAAVHYQEQPGTGLLALYLLALRAACHSMETPEGNWLITQLKLHLHKEKERIGHRGEGNPITNYYQYSLGILALCVHKKKIDEHVIHKLSHAEEHGRFQHNGDVSVDTEAMAGLAFVCLQEAPFYTPELKGKLDRSLQRVKEKILQAQTSEGAFGNIYSSPLAVQFLIAARMRQKKPECPAAMAALFRSLEQGDFRNSLIKSQLLPVLYGKSYLDIARQECHVERGGPEESLVLAAPTSASRKTNLGEKRIGVQLVVKRPPRRLPLYKHVLSVPTGSSLLEVLEAAKGQSHGTFMFETQSTLSGPMLTSVMGVKAQEGERKYWKILRAPNFILDEGIADYIPKHKETIILRFMPW
uniref:Transcobalamin-2 n=2 Tax=Pogona vitticeps TaxID=103695 RepID=A0ABM5F2E2_9SAUR